jgi:hypothetical protein
MNLKNILITLSIVAVVLVAITFYVVFYGSSGTYVVSSNLGPNADIFATGTVNVAATSSLALTTGTASSTTVPSTLAVATDTATSSIETDTAPITWTQGNETLSITGAAIAGPQLTLDVQVTMGRASECVPLNLRMIADEQGNLAPPITSQFTFPDTGTCNGTAGETYSAQSIVFTLANPGVFPVILTTGGTANILFEVDQNPDGSLSVQLPPSSG